MEQKKEIEICSLIGTMEGLIICLKLEKRDSLKYEIDFLELCETLQKIKKIMLS